MTFTLCRSDDAGGWEECATHRYSLAVVLANGNAQYRQSVDTVAQSNMGIRWGDDLAAAPLMSARVKGTGLDCCPALGRRGMLSPQLPARCERRVPGRAR